MPSTAPDVKTRILVISDTHSALPYPTETIDWPFRWPLPKADILIHAGDLTARGQISEHERTVDLIARIDAELKIVIPGNHDITLDLSYYEEFGHIHGQRSKYGPDELRKIREMYTGETAREANIAYMEEGLQSFTLRNGARFNVYASAYQPEFCKWAFAYPRYIDRFNPSGLTGFQAPNPIPDFSDDATNAVDIMVTHGPPYGILDSTLKNEQVGCHHLLSAVERCKPRLHVFGHIHESSGAILRNWNTNSEHDEEKEQKIKISDHKRLVEEMATYVHATDLRHGNQTLFINASIMSLQYKPIQSPWLVDIMLPTR